MRVGCVLFLADLSGDGITRFAEACLRWTPRIAVTREAVFLEIGKCRRLYDEKSLRPRLDALARRFQLPFRLAFAPDPATALASARWGRGDSPREHLPVEALHDYADPFGLNPEGLARPARDMSIRLRKLGVTSVGEFSRIPPATLSPRFGKIGLLVHQRILEAERIPWPRFVPRDRIVERAGGEFCEGELNSIQDIEALIFALRSMADRAMARLNGRGERASLIRLRLGLERSSALSHPSREWLIQLALPQGSGLGILQLVREKLDFELQAKPLPAPVARLELEIVETAPGRRAQRDFFQAREEEVEAWSSLVGRLTGKLGENRVFVARIVERYLPEKGWVRALPTDESRGDPDADIASARKLPPRPLRLLREPEALLRADASEGPRRCARDGALFSLVLARAAPGLRRGPWRVLGVEGPEILSGEWWFRQFERRYYKIRTHTGEWLWVFRSPGAEAFFLHGYFD